MNDIRKMTCREVLAAALPGHDARNHSLDSAVKSPGFVLLVCSCRSVALVDGDEAREKYKSTPASVVQRLQQLGRAVGT